MTYHDEQTIKLNDKVQEILKTLPDFSAKFFSDLSNQERSPLTCQQYAYDMKKFFEFIGSSAGFKDVKLKSVTADQILDKLTIDDINEYAESLKTYDTVDSDGNIRRELASSSIRARRMCSLRSFYRYYYKIGEIKNNIADLIPVPEVKGKPIVAMDLDQVSRILEAVSNTDGMSETDIKKHKKLERRDFAILMLFFGTGLRVSELVGIDVSDIDFYNASINVTRKGGDSDIIYFGPEVESALSEYLEVDRPSLLGNIKEDAFFLSMQHKRLGVRSIELLIKGYADKAGLNIKVTPHTLRKTFGTHLYENTGDIYLVADALHHSSVDTTRKHYTKMSEEHKRIAAKKSSDLFK